MRQIFVFGSNLAGRHGRGAAREAYKYHGAEYGIGEGLTGDSYALPTKDTNLRVRSLEDIENSVSKFLNFADGNPDLLFFTTPFGTGYAGYTIKEILSTFNIEDVPNNVLFTASWFK